MTINRDMLDEYLDGQLAPPQMAQIDQELKANPAAAQLLTQMQRQRALRRTVLNGYEPAPAVAANLAAKWLAEFAEAEAAPIAQIGPRLWFRSIGALAAALLVMAGGFALGRGTAATAPVAQTIPHVESVNVASSATKYLAPDINGDMQEYGSAGDAKRAWQDALVAMEQQKSSTQVADADVIAPHGSF